MLYINTLFHEYTVDDGTVIKNNKITTKGISALPEIFTSSYRAGFWERKEGLYRPLSVAMFAIEWQLAPDQPWLGHLINILLYALTAFMLMKLMLLLFNKKDKVIPFIITMLFIAHPVHTEVVANIKSRDEILCFLFAILSMQQLMIWLRHNKQRSLLTAAALFFLALLSKESAITLLAVYPLLAWTFGSATRKQLITSAGTFLVTGILFMSVRYAVIGTIAGTDAIQLINNTLVGTDNAVVRFATAVSILGKYLVLLILPVTLVFDYSYNTLPLVNISSPAAFIPLVVLTALFFLAVKNIARKKSWSFGVLFFFITISLVSNIVFLIEATMAERFLYMPSLGFCIAAVTSGHFLIKQKQGRKPLTFYRQLVSSPVYLLFTAVILLFSFRTIARNNDWKNNLTLLSEDVKAAPNSARIRYAYGSAILIEQALKEDDKIRKRELLLSAINHLEKGVSIIDDYADAWYHLGIAYKEAEDPANAIRSFEKSRAYKPFKDADAYIASALAYGMSAQYQKAIADLNAALELDPVSTEALNNLGLYYNDVNETEKSIIVLQKAITLKPDFSKAYYNLGNTYAKTGNYTIALENYRKAIAIDPSYSDAYNNSGNCFSAMNIADSAFVYYTQAVQADPENVKALINLGVTWHNRGDTVQANSWFQKARALGAAI